MIVQGPHGTGTKDKIFAHVESESTSAISRGAVVVWDLTDNSATAGILENTRGLRINTTTTAKIKNVAGIMEEATVGTLANNRGRMYMCQIYGHHDAGLFTSSSSTAPVAIFTSATEGRLDALGTTVGADVGACCGFTFEDTTGTGTYELFVKAM